MNNQKRILWGAYFGFAAVAVFVFAILREHFNVLSNTATDWIVIFLSGPIALLTTVFDIADVAATVLLVIYYFLLGYLVCWIFSVAKTKFLKLAVIIAVILIHIATGYLCHKMIMAEIARQLS